MYGNLKRGEDTEQMGVIDWTNWNRGRFPELQLIFHIPNGGKRNATEAARFKAVESPARPLPMTRWSNCNISDFFMA